MISRHGDFYDFTPPHATTHQFRCYVIHLCGTPVLRYLRATALNVKPYRAALYEVFLALCAVSNQQPRMHIHGCLSHVEEHNVPSDSRELARVPSATACLASRDDPSFVSTWLPRSSRPRSHQHLPRFSPSRAVASHTRCRPIEMASSLASTHASPRSRKVSLRRRAASHLPPRPPRQWPPRQPPAPGPRRPCLCSSPRES